MRRRISAALSIMAALAMANPSLAGFDQGLAAYRAGDYERAFEEFRADAIDGHATAQFNLGVMYYKGQGVSRDLIKAFAWIEIATQQRGQEDLIETLEILTLMLSGQEVDAGLQMAGRLARNHDLKYRPVRSELDATRIAGR